MNHLTTTRRRRLTKAATVSVLASALLLTGCTPADPDDENSKKGEETTHLATLGPRDVHCPGNQADLSVPLSGLDEAFLEAYVLDPEENNDKVSGGTYCLQVNIWDEDTPAPVKVTIKAPGNDRNYGESYTVTDPDGSEEITYFPYAVGVYGKCRPVTATVTMRNGATHTATLRIGNRCATS